LLTDGEGNTAGGEKRESPIDLTESKTLSMRGHSMHENREGPRTPDGEGPSGRSEKGVETGRNRGEKPGTVAYL
jgi:hypothetical protein